MSKTYLYGKNPLQEAILFSKRKGVMPLSEIFITKAAEADSTIMSILQANKLEYSVVTSHEIESSEGGCKQEDRQVHPSLPITNGSRSRKQKKAHQCDENNERKPGACSEVLHGGFIGAPLDEVTEPSPTAERPAL